MRRLFLRAAVAVLATLQVAILIYLALLLWPAAPAHESAQTPTPGQFGLPSAGSTPRPQATRPVTEAIVVGPPVEATDVTRRAALFDAELAMEHIAYFASPEREGRQPGTAGGYAAADYIARHFAAVGLQPAGIDASYFQTFTVVYGRITEPPVLAVALADGTPLTRTYRYRIDYRALTGGYVGDGEGEGEVVWLSNCLADDYAGLDMVGKIALCRYTRNDAVYRQAIEHGVGGLLLLDWEHEDEPFRRPTYRQLSWVPQTIPAYLISRRVAEELVLGSGYTVDQLSLRYMATPLSTTVRMAVTVEEREAVDARNVLGLLPGSDPEHRDELVIIGAHYDHLGRDPDGAVMGGANDNASGVAVLLEIARLWHEQGIRPARSVLFAAWDAEEMGLLGSRYYVSTPTWPLTRTVAMLNLDMVGAGEELLVDGSEEIVRQLQVSAAVYGITTTVSSSGGSDHFSFQEAGIPAAMLIYWPDPHYHDPADTAEAIEPDKLRAVGVTSAHALAAFAQGHVEIEEAVERLRAAILSRDRAAFSGMLDPRDPDLQAAQMAWFDNLWSRELVEVEIEPGEVRMGDGEAEATVTAAYRWADATRSTPSATYGIRFVERDGLWTYAGYGPETLSGDVVTVGRFENVPVSAQQLLSTTQESYLALAAALEMEPLVGTRVVYYPNANVLRSVALPATERADVRWLVSSAGLAELAYGQPLEPPLVNLLLNQMGLPAGAAPWLREGLAQRFAGEGAVLTALAGDEPLPALADFPALDGLSEEEATLVRAQAWAVTDYLLETRGTAGLHALCAAWGETGDGDAAFQQALGLSLSQFEAEWRSAWLEPLRADAAALEVTLAARAQAILAGDAAAFMRTVTAADAVLRIEEQHWADDLAAHPAVTCTLEGEIAGWTPGADAMTVDLTLRAQLADGAPVRVSDRVRFVRENGRWLYAGPIWEEWSSEHFVLKYRGHDEAWARRALELAEAVYARLVADLGAAPPLPVEVKIYGDQAQLGASVYLSLPDWVSGWTEPGESIRLWLADEREQTFVRLLAHELTHQALFARGVEYSWLHEGIANYEAGRVIALGTHWMAGRYMPVVQEAVRRHREFSLSAWPDWEALSADEAELAYAQAWSLVDFAVGQMGEGGLRRLVERAAVAADPAAVLSAEVGDLGTFWEAWRANAFVAGVPAEVVAVARGFDVDAALAHVAVLSSAAYGGREAGTAEGDLAAQYIATQFGVLGLQPLGDVVTVTVGQTETREVSYFQHFPLSHSQIVSTPLLALLDEGGEVVHGFSYRQDFMAVAGGGVAEGELVWVRDPRLEELHFDGAIVIEQSVRDPLARAGQLAERGAGGLVVVGGRDAAQLQAAYGRPAANAAPIPVFEITEEALGTLRECLGLEASDLSASPPALPLGVRARQELVRMPLTTTMAANVVGFLPGSDPRLAQEVIVVGAHYDQLGRTPDGLYYPGANQNASGVAAMLEMARAWQAAGYRPARSVLLVAWGAQEAGGAGVAYYLEHPALPLTQTVGVVALDSIAGGEGYRLLFYGTREEDAPLVHRLEAGAQALGRQAWRRGSAGEGWHTAFEDVPTVKLIWDGAEPYLFTDTVEQIDPNRLASSGEILTLLIAWLASP